MAFRLLLHNSFQFRIKKLRVNDFYSQLLFISSYYLIKMWSIRDSNSSPLDCQSNALAR